MNATFDQDRKDTKIWFDWSKHAVSAVLTQGEDIVRVWGRANLDTESRHQVRLMLVNVLMEELVPIF